MFHNNTQDKQVEISNPFRLGFFQFGFVQGWLIGSVVALIITNLIFCHLHRELKKRVEIIEIQLKEKQ